MIGVGELPLLAAFAFLPVPQSDLDRRLAASWRVGVVPSCHNLRTTNDKRHDLRYVVVVNVGHRIASQATWRPSFDKFNQL